MRRSLVLFLLFLFVCGGVQAQDVRYKSGGGGILNRAFRAAAEDQRRTDYPIKSEGRPGTAVRLTFDPQNADADILSDKGYGTAQLLKTTQELSREMGLPETDYIVDQRAETTSSVDMEFNDYLTHPGPRTTAFDFDLARFANALQKSDLPKPIVFGIRSDHSRLNRVSLVTPDGARPLDGIVFLGADEVKPGTRLHWEATVHWSGYIAAAFFGGTISAALILVLRGTFKKPVSPEASIPDPTEVQKRYDKMPPMAVMMLGMPLLMFVLFLTGAAGPAMESMLYLLPTGILMIVMVGCAILMFGATLLRPLIQKRWAKQQITPTPDPDDPPAWTKTAFLTGLMPTMLLMMVMAFLLPVWNPLRALPAPARHSATTWFPPTLVVVGFLPAIIAGTLAMKKTRRTLKPGEFWHDRVMELARQAGVPVKNVVEVWSAAPNAYASIFGTVGLTRGLLHKLEPEEVEAVIAHELGHHIGGHPRRTFVVGLLTTFGLIGAWWGFLWYLETHFKLSSGTKALLESPLFVIFILPLLQGLLQGKGQRERELAADRFAVDVTGDAELVVRALTRVHDLGGSPHRLKPADEAIHTHPSLERRIASIRAYADEKHAASATGTIRPPEENAI